MEPDNEAVLGLVRHLPADELKILLNDDSKVANIIADLPQIQQMAQEKEMLLVSNKSLAEHNLSMEPQLTEGKQTLIASYEEAAKLADALTALKASTDSSVGKYKPDTVQALLQTAAHEKEEETEKLVKGFLDKEITVEDFIEEFISSRTVAHTRRIKAEKVAEMIRTGRISNGSGSTATTTTPYPAFNSPPGLPYPTSFNMPMPGF